MRKCIKCGEPATVTFGADPDMRGVPSCDNCKDAVQTALLLSLMDEKEDFFKLLKALK